MYTILDSFQFNIKEFFVFAELIDISLFSALRSCKFNIS